jgi:hypothetical protein
VNEIQLSGKITAGPEFRETGGGATGAFLTLEFKVGSTVRVFATASASQELKGFETGDAIKLTGRLIVNPTTGVLDILASNFYKWRIVKHPFPEGKNRKLPDYNWENVFRDLSHPQRGAASRGRE